MNTRISLFVTVFTVINILACMWLLWWTARGRSNKTATGEVERTGHVWDEDLEEYNNPLPRWWLGLFVITTIFGAGYLLLFPGLGNFMGLKKWTSTQQYEAQVNEARARFEERLASSKDKPLAELAHDPAAMSTARNLFAANCSGCHGSDARGARGFPNLTDKDWLWGGDSDRVYETIANGRHGAMPAWGAVLGEEGVNQVASYVMSISGRNAPADWVTAGKATFANMCAACHGADGKGNPLLGAPNLTDGIWLHGGDFDSIRATITGGRENQMPSHLPLLGETKVRLLAAYVLSLSGAPQPQTVQAAQTSATDGHGGNNGAAL
ncbi:MAG TPA: cytochrome-c oxidase, cbb3-type subunit III [Steroidobacteraceae bacterium]|nr:cytochrome-c oxidase, cbb3-type subunit III [Steroidobacteraceae bacterium]